MNNSFASRCEIWKQYMGPSDILSYNRPLWSFLKSCAAAHVASGKGKVIKEFGNRKEIWAGEVRRVALDGGTRGNEFTQEEERTRWLRSGAYLRCLPARASISISETLSLSGCIPLEGAWLKDRSWDSFRLEPGTPPIIDGFRRGSMSSSNCMWEKDEGHSLSEGSF